MTPVSRRPTVAAMAAAALCLPMSAAFLSRESMPLRCERLLAPKGCRIYGMLPRDNNGGSGEPTEDSDEVEAARKRLEAMLVGNVINRDESVAEQELPRRELKLASSKTSPLHPINVEEELLNPPPLTAIARERMETEITLLASLEESDEALSNLWSLWFSWKGPGPAVELLMAEELAGKGPKMWAEAEAGLRMIIAEHGIHWAEPINRLATLLYQQGRLQESKEMCEIVLATKPWHFGALSGIVQVCSNMGDTTAARMWADRRLPPIQPTGDNRRRTEWVKRAVKESSRSLKKAEEMLQRSFTKCDEDYGRLSSNFDRAEFDDSWQ